MDTVVWVVQGLLAFMFLMAGFMKATQPLDKLEKMLGDWVQSQPTRVIGIAEILGAVGLIAPHAANIVPILTPIAACALGVVMMLAAKLHVERKEMPKAGMAVVLLCMAVFVALARFGVFAG